MNKNITKLKPTALWGYFDEILKIPRPSKQEEKIAAYVIEFAKKHKLSYKQDAIGNVLITKPATPGMENRKTVCLQSHLDMVCEKNKDKKFDFEKDAIQAYIDGDWVTADGTTLGADDGIGVATQLAILSSGEIAHGPLECLFTVDEETGLSGAFGLAPGFLKSEILLNLDSEDDGQIFIGCAGGRDTIARFHFTKELIPDWNIPFKIVVGGLKGGHSGDDINKGLGNANKILVRILYLAMKKYGIRLHNFNGGNLRNAIAREAEAIVLINQTIKEKFVRLVDDFNATVKKELKTTEPDLIVKTFQVDPPYFVIDQTSQRNLINALYACPHGVIQMSREIPNFVETSTNLASVKTLDDGFLITTSQRSSVSSALDDVVNMVESTFRLINADVEHSDGYPGWTPNPDSEILKISEQAYKKLFNENPKVLAVHAGLECGLIGEKYPGMDMISIGPDIKGAHSPDERILIQSVERFWDWTLEILKQIPEKKI
ncbi:MAG TPA: aminoacyl-histidine dipeptidase [Bacteroidales bacterium]|nr:aminoacyl-histidine dipeptidase [Bacteroidales bacterium]HRX11146.1 aminoacyl-histidine dipeptidase [Draconibacterium sp.]